MIERSPIDLLPMFARGLELCALEPQSNVAIYTENGQRSNYAQAFASAATELGHSAFVVDARVPFQRVTELSTEYGLSGSRPLVDALKDCDLLIDLVMLLFTAEKIEIQKSGTRILTCVEPPDVIERLFPTPHHREEARRGEELLRGASSIRVTSAAGTDLVYQLGQMSPLCQYGLADEPGRWDHFASTFVATAGNDGGVDGTVVFNVGDIVTPYIHYIREPVRCTVEGGHIVDVQGSGLEAMFLRDQFARFDEDATAISHIGWGINPSARWDALRMNPNHIGLDPRSYRGCVLFSTGPNLDFGGTNTSRCHFDMPMRDCSLWVDDQLIVDEGCVVSQVGEAEGVA